MNDLGFHVDDGIDLDLLLNNIDDLNWDGLDELVGNLPDSGCNFSIEDLDQYLVNEEVVLCDSPPKESSSSDNLPNSGCNFSIEDIDQYLVNGEVVLCDSPPKECSSGPDSDVVQKDSSSSPDSDVVQKDGGLEVRECNVDGSVEDDDDSDDPAAKKLKRKLRNKDAAMRSRERKKQYVQDLEMKSKYFEAECRRLGNLLQCCLAENQALRFSLHTSKAIGAPVTGQESAVLLLELLLLGSLLGPLGIICLLILPSQLLSTLEVALLRKGAKELGRVAPRKATSDVNRCLVPESFTKGRRCKASRSRFKDGARWPLANLLVT